MSDDADIKFGEAEASSESAGPASAMQRNILAVVHDLNNPLSIIAGNAQLLAEIAKARDLGDEVYEPLQDIERAVEQMSAQLERLSDLSRVPPG